MDIGKTRERANDYSAGDIAGLRGHESESTAGRMNEIRHDSGYTGEVDVNGKTLKDVKREQAGLTSTGAQSTGLHALGALIEAGAEEGAAALIGSAIGVGAMLYEYAMLPVETQEQKDAVEGDNAKRAMYSQLELPDAFKEKLIGEVDGKHTEGSQSAATVIATKIHTDPKERAKFALVQLHCDNGMAAAREACSTGVDAQAYLAAHADVGAQYASDPAFRAGFDCVVWAKGQSDKSIYDGVLAQLRDRDVRYDAAHVAHRG